MFEKVLTKILASSHDFAVNIIMVINITINKTFSIHDLIKKLFIATMSSTKRISILFDVFNIYTSTYR